MPYDQGLARLLRADLGEERELSEKPMFGGVAFLVGGHMVCGLHSSGGMFRVGAANVQAARTDAGPAPTLFAGRVMSGMVDVSKEALADTARRQRMMALALEFLRGLPAK